MGLYQPRVATSPQAALGAQSPPNLVVNDQVLVACPDPSGEG